MDAYGLGDKMANGRYCEPCNTMHGVLYACEHYSPELLEEIEKDRQKYIANLNNSKWCQKQLDNGLSQEGLAIFKAMAGVPS